MAIKRELNPELFKAKTDLFLFMPIVLVLKKNGTILIVLILGNTKSVSGSSLISYSKNKLFVCKLTYTSGKAHILICVFILG